MVTVTQPGQRRTPKAAKTNSVAKKAVMAVSGIILVLYLIAHMIGNLKVFAGRETFNGYSHWIRTIGEPAVPAQTTLTIIRIVLLAAVIAHIWAAISLWRQAKRARPNGYGTKKAIMAVSGIIMVLYLIVHMIGNLKAFAGAEAFNHYSGWNRTVGNPALPGATVLWIIRLVLLAAVVAHFWAAISLWRQAKRARPNGYVTKKAVAQSYASRTMRWGGVIVGLFIVYHILDLTLGVANPEGHDSTPYDRLVASFSNPPATAVYVIA
mgnify:CR=1 FL=1